MSGKVRWQIHVCRFTTSDGTFDAGQFAVIQPDRVAFRTGIDHDIAWPVVRMSFHVTFTSGTTQASRRRVRVNWTHLFLFQTNSSGTAFVNDRTKMFATHEHSEAAGAIENRSPIQLPGLKKV